MRKARARRPRNNLLKPRKIPLRQCAGCREKKPKKELIRVVRSPEGTVDLDKTGKAPGRGAYVCLDADCLKKAQKSKAIERALEVSVSADVYESMLTQIGETSS